MTTYDAAQRSAITNYRNTHHLSSNVSDENVVKQMKANGKLPSCFSSLATSTPTKLNGWNNEAEHKELQSLGLKNNNNYNTKIKDKKGNIYTVIGDGASGRKIARDKNGQIQVIAQDGTLLKKTYVKETKDGKKQTQQGTYKNTVNQMKQNVNSANKEFQKQLADDGWAGDVADYTSALWGSKNRASKVREDLKTERQNIKDLTTAAQKGEASFKAKFKQIYGIDYNQTAIDNYTKEPTAENYKKAYGTKYPDIRTRVKEYNKSQQTGAEVVKTGAKVGAGIVVGVATGGIGVAAAVTAAASVVVEESDRYKITSGGGFREGTDHAKILKSAAWDGASVVAGGAVGKAAGAVIKDTTKAAIAGRAAITVSGDVAMGAAQEYAETGEVTATGVLTNAAMSGLGSAISSGVLKYAKNKMVKFVKNFKESKTSTTKNTTKANISADAPTPKSINREASTQNKTSSSVKENEQGATTPKADKKTYNKPTLEKISVQDDIYTGGTSSSKSSGGILSSIKSMFSSNPKSYNINQGKVTDVGNGITVSPTATQGQVIVATNRKPKAVTCLNGQSKQIGTTSNGTPLVLKNENGNLKVVEDANFIASTPTQPARVGTSNNNSSGIEIVRTKRRTPQQTTETSPQTNTTQNAGATQPQAKSAAQSATHTQAQAKAPAQNTTHAQAQAKPTAQSATNTQAQAKPAAQSATNTQALQTKTSTKNTTPTKAKSSNASEQTAAKNENTGESLTTRRNEYIKNEIRTREQNISKLEKQLQENTNLKNTLPNKIKECENKIAMYKKVAARLSEYALAQKKVAIAKQICDNPTNKYQAEHGYEKYDQLLNELNDQGINIDYLDETTEIGGVINAYNNNNSNSGIWQRLELYEGSLTKMKSKLNEVTSSNIESLIEKAKNELNTFKWTNPIYSM